MAHTWILLAEEGRARLLEREERDSPLSEGEAFTNPAGHMHESELTSDLPGSSSAAGAGRHNVDTDQGPKAHSREVFAKMLADRLDDARVEHLCERLVLIAPPRFLGLLRKHLGDNTARIVEREIGKNLVRHSLDEVLEQLERD